MKIITTSSYLNNVSWSLSTLSCNWFDGDIFQDKTAETLRSRIEALK
jgi:hypothetical protein